jgi:integrase
VGLANKTMQQRLTAVRLFYDYLMEIGERDTNPVGRGRYTPGTGFNGVRERGLIRRFEKQPWIPGDREWEGFLDVLVREEFLRNQAMAFVSYDGALRRSELVSLELSDIDFSHQKITIRSETTKNGFGRIVFYSDATSDLLCLYVEHRQCILKTHLKTRPRSLFVSESRRNRGEPLTCEMWNKSVQSVARRASLPLFTTHTFRHLRLTDLARCKLELHEIAMYAGHRSLKSTHQYIQLSSVELEERVRLATKHLDERNKRLLERVRRGHEN